LQAQRNMISKSVAFMHEKYQGDLSRGWVDPAEGAAGAGL